MTRHWSPLAITYLPLAIAALLGTWFFNALAIIQLRDFIGDLVTSGPAVSSITVDLLVVAVAVAGCMIIVAESRRLGMRWAWLYILGSGLTAFAFTFPCFWRCASDG